MKRIYELGLWWCKKKNSST